MILMGQEGGGSGTGLTYPLADTVIVGKDSGTFSTIAAAVASITDAAANKPYKVLVQAGVYQETTPVDMKDYIEVSGLGQKATIVQAAAGQNLFNLCQHCSVSSMQVSGATSTLFNGNAGAAHNTLKDISFGSCLVGILNQHLDSRIEVFDINVLDGSSIGDLCQTIAGVIYIFSTIVSGTPTVTRIFNANGASARINVSSLFASSHNVTDTFYMNNGGKIMLFDSATLNATNNIHIGPDGTESTFIGRGGHFEDSTLDILNESPTGKINIISGDIALEKVNSLADFAGLGWDDTEDKFRIQGETTVGISGIGHTLQVGEGGSYKMGAITFTYDGATYTEIAEGDDISFPNLNVNTAIYFGEGRALEFFGLEYIMGAVKLDLGTGSVVWEYYDATNGWQEFKTLNNITGYSDNYNGSSFIGDNDESQTIRFDQDIQTGVKESNATNTGMEATTVNGSLAMWVRCRITATITTSPIFDHLRVQPNYFGIRKNGTTSFHGAARGVKNIPIPFGDSGSGGASKTLEISPNIDYPYWNNSLSNTGIHQLYVRFVITEDVDTSCGLLLRYILSTPHTGVVDLVGKVDIYCSHVKSGESFDGVRSETVNASNFLYTANDPANLAHFIKMTQRIDISGLQEDDIVFCMIQRNAGHGDDTLNNTLDFSHIYVEYRTWQNGRQLKV